MADDTKKPEGLDLMRAKFPPNMISKLPKATKKQTEDLKAAMARRDFSLGVRCTLCGQYHHKDVAHLDYVGHAALTDRLLDCDPRWNWEPLAFGPDGMPAVDKFGGMWIKLTVCGETRLGYGSADGKTGGDAVKELIGDALRNAAMRFGAALDLWHKGDLHADEEAQEAESAPKPQQQQRPAQNPNYDLDADFNAVSNVLRSAQTVEELNAFWAAEADARRRIGTANAAAYEKLKDVAAGVKVEIEAKAKNADIGADDIPY